VWASGAAYEPFIGRWSRLVAREFLRWLAIPPGRRWLDVGCGTGVLTRGILEVAQPAAVLGVDSSAEYIGFARHQTSDPRASFAVADARALPDQAEPFDAVVAGLVLNFLPEPERALASMQQVACPGATLAAYVWDYADGMQMLRAFWDAAVSLDSDAYGLDEGRRFGLCAAGALVEAFERAGLQQVEGRSIEVPTRFSSFDDYWSPFLGGQGPAPSYLAGLDSTRQAALRERLQARLPLQADGSIELVARAWAARGVTADRT
jgi:SAM-dependent methyltransferase